MVANHKIPLQCFVQFGITTRSVDIRPTIPLLAPIYDGNLKLCAFIIPISLKKFLQSLERILHSFGIQLVKIGTL